MIADIAGANRAEQGVRQRVHADIGVGMPLQLSRVRNFDAAQNNAIAWREGMHVKPLTGPEFEHGAFPVEKRFRHAEIFRLRDFHIVRRTADKHGFYAGGFGDRRVVCQRPPFEGAMRFKNGFKVEPLRGLGAPEPIARRRSVDRFRIIGAGAFERVEDGQGGDRAGRMVERSDDARNCLGVDERAGGVVNQDFYGRLALKAFEPETHRILSFGAAMNRWKQFLIIQKIAHCSGVERFVVRMDNDADAVNFGVCQEDARCSRKDRRSGKPPILFGSAGAGAGSPPGGDDNGDRAGHSLCSDAL